MKTHIRFFFGEEKSNTPPYLEYTIGFNILQKYCEAFPQTSFTELIQKDEE